MYKNILYIQYISHNSLKHNYLFNLTKQMLTLKQNIKSDSKTNQTADFCKKRQCFSLLNTYYIYLFFIYFGTNSFYIKARFHQRN